MTAKAAPTKPLTENWRRLIAFCKANPYCTLQLTVANGEPVVADEVLAKYRFDQPTGRLKEALDG